MVEGAQVESIHCSPLSLDELLRLAGALGIEFQVFPNGEIVMDCNGAAAGPFTEEEARGIVEGADHFRDMLLDAGAESVSLWASMIGARNGVR
jgi:hypothetical protein